MAVVLPNSIFRWRCYTWFVQLISINYVSIFSQKGIFMISDRLLCTYLWHFHGYLQCMAVSPMKEWMSPDNHQHTLSAAPHISDHPPVQNLQEKTEAWPSWPVVHLSFGNMINVDDIFVKTPSWRYKNNDWWNASVSYGDCIFIGSRHETAVLSATKLRHHRPHPFLGGPSCRCLPSRFQLWWLHSSQCCKKWCSSAGASVLLSWELSEFEKTIFAGIMVPIFGSNIPQKIEKKSRPNLVFPQQKSHKVTKLIPKKSLRASPWATYYRCSNSGSYQISLQDTIVHHMSSCFLY